MAGSVPVLDLPEGSTFGCDQHLWGVGPHFQGVRSLRHGYHLLVASAGTGGGVRTGCFVHVPRCQEVEEVIRVVRWDKRDECLVSLIEEEADKVRGAVKRGEYGMGMAPLPEEGKDAWARLTSYITEAVLERAGINGDTILDGVSSSSFSFSSLGDARRPSPSMTPTEVTQHNMDPSRHLEDVLSSTYSDDWRLLLGEFELSFLIFLQLLNLKAFEHWKALLILLSSAEEAMGKRGELFHAFLEVIIAQLHHVPEDFFIDEQVIEADVRGGSFLGICLARVLKSSSSSSSLSDPLNGQGEGMREEADELRMSVSPSAFQGGGDKREELKSLIASRFGVELEGAFDGEGEEYAPSVVDVNESMEGRDSMMTPEEMLPLKSSQNLSRMEWMLGGGTTTGSE